MMWILKWLAVRPSDKKIVVWNLIFWVVWVAIIFYNLLYLNKSLETEFFWMDATHVAQYIKIFAVLLMVIPIINGLNLPLLKAKYIRIYQIFLGIFLIYFSGKAVETPDLDYNIVLLILWIIALIFWITWKAITKKWLRYWEKIQKIRV